MRLTWAQICVNVVHGFDVSAQTALNIIAKEYENFPVSLGGYVYKAMTDRNGTRNPENEFGKHTLKWCLCRTSAINSDLSANIVVWQLLDLATVVNPRTPKFYDEWLKHGGMEFKYTRYHEVPIIQAGNMVIAYEGIIPKDETQEPFVFKFAQLYIAAVWDSKEGSRVRLQIKAVDGDKDAATIATVFADDIECNDLVRRTRGAARQRCRSLYVYKAVPDIAEVVALRMADFVRDPASYHRLTSEELTA